MNAIDLAEELQARSDLSSPDGITRAIEATTAQLLTRDQADARFAEPRAELKTDIAELRAEMHQLIRAQTIWQTTTMIGIAGVIIAVIELLP